jgi:hypothetical protein
VFDHNETSRLLKKLLYMGTPLEQTGLPNVHFCFPRIIVLDVNLLIIILIIFRCISFCKCRTGESEIFLTYFPHAEEF